MTVIQNTVPAIAADPSDTSTTVVEIEFPFKDGIVSGEVTLHLSPYNGAKREGAKSIPLFGCSPKQYYAAIVNDPAQDEMYAELLGFFEGYSKEHNLTSDEYVELLTTYVQNIPYKTVGAAVNFPIETVIENKGDCDDKSVLLSGLLAKSGYAAGVAVFSEANHMTAAIKAEEAGQVISSYILIETTRYAYIGENAAVIRSRTKNRTRVREDSVILVGGGTAAYTVSWQVDTILEQRDRIVETIDSLSQEMRTLKTEIMGQEVQLAQAYDPAVYEKYEKNLTSYNEYMETCYAYFDELDVINTGSYSREETYEMVASMM
ncbi:hypothetical protein [Methanocorpusculum labreanum]|nr:hypothetical protein [Methanocorpusculum labreanum]